MIEIGPNLSEAIAMLPLILLMVVLIIASIKG